MAARVKLAGGVALAPTGVAARATAGSPRSPQKQIPITNLGLGERRAKAVKDYLIAAGVPADRISTISFGKERPFVLGHDKSAWKWNRRGHFVLLGK